VDRALACAALVLVVHGQIEMTFFDPGSVVWMMCILGLAGGAVARAGRAWGGIAASIALLLLAVGLALAGPRKIFKAQARMFEAATLLYPPAETPTAVARRREQAADLLRGAYDLSPSWVMPLDEAVRQLLVAATLVEAPQRLELIDNAVALAQRAMAEHDKPTSVALAGEAAWFRATETGDPDDWQQAIDLNRRLTDIDPHGIGSWHRYGDVLWDSGRRGEAAAAYERALDHDANFELDPLKQLADRDRDPMRARIDSVR
jgi:tetratricopeptide (TPR) repeat protein